MQGFQEKAVDQVFVINPKGGCGKTTLSTQLAGYYACRGKRVLLADHDAQKSSSDWLASRPESACTIRCVALKPENALNVDDTDVVIHDMPAAWTLKNIHSIVRPGDRLLIPVLASPTDIKACLRFIMSLNREGIMDSQAAVGLVANKVRTNTRYFAVLNTFLQKVGLPIVGQLRDSQNYVRLMDRGLSVFDLPSKRLQRDIDEWVLILDWLNIEA